MTNYVQKIPFVLFLSMLLATTTINADQFTFDYQKIIPAPQPTKLTLDLTRGTITVSGTDEGNLVIEATKVIMAGDRLEAEEVADHIEINVDRIDNIYRTLQRSS